MVQLNTTYDSSLKQKIFVLKGDEGYARTTDVIAELITDFDDYDDHINYCHVGLAIKVLRELGKSTLYIYADDELLYAIPWHDTGMAEVIDSDWNDKGVYWDSTNKQLLIGKYETTPEYIDTGLFLLYDVEHTIKVKYLGNKNCLGSHAKPIVFTVPTPDTFATTLTLTGSNPPVYDRGADVSNLSLLLECGLSLQSSKSVKIYDGSTHLTTVTATQDTPLTVDLSSYTLTDGLHTIKAVFDGDDECFGTETELNISIGYVLTDVTYPSTLMTGDTGSITATIKNYFDEPVSGETIKISKYASSTYTDLSSTTSSSSGEVSFSNVALTSDPWVFTYSNWHSGQYTTHIVGITDISIQARSLAYKGLDPIVVGYILDGSTPQQKSGIPIDITYTDLDNNQSTYTTMTNDMGRYASPYGYSADGKGTVNVTVTVKNTQISNNTQIHDLSVCWLHNAQVGDVTHYGTSVSRQSNGYKFIAGSDGSHFVFQFPNSTNKDYTMEFDVVSINSSEYDMFMGIRLSDLTDGITQGDKIKVTAEWQGENDVLNTVYVNNQVVGTKSVDGIGFYYLFASKNEYLVLNNIKIERTG